MFHTYHTYSRHKFRVTSSAVAEFSDALFVGFPWLGVQQLISKAHLGKSGGMRFVDYPGPGIHIFQSLNSYIIMQIMERNRAKQPLRAPSLWQTSLLLTNMIERKIYSNITCLKCSQLPLREQDPTLRKTQIH